MKNFYKIIFFIGLALWWAETVYFGFNRKPENGIEAMLDITSVILMVYGIVADILTNLTIKKDTVINTQTVNFKSKTQKGNKDD